MDVRRPAPASIHLTSYLSHPTTLLRVFVCFVVKKQMGARAAGLTGAENVVLFQNLTKWRNTMQKNDFKKIRKILKKTQKEMASLLGVSKKAVESYEQGLRNIPPNSERLLYFLLFKLNMEQFGKKELCWQKKNCTPEIRKDCVAWLAREGFFCWFITGRVCEGTRASLSNGDCCESCFDCSFFKEQLSRVIPSE